MLWVCSRFVTTVPQNQWPLHLVPEPVRLGEARSCRGEHVHVTQSILLGLHTPPLSETPRPSRPCLPHDGLADASRRWGGEGLTLASNSEMRSRPFSRPAVMPSTREDCPSGRVRPLPSGPTDKGRERARVANSSRCAYGHRVCDNARWCSRGQGQGGDLVRG